MSEVNRFEVESPTELLGRTIRDCTTGDTHVVTTASFHTIAVLDRGERKEYWPADEGDIWEFIN